MRVFLNPQYSHALQSSASSIGVAVEELMRHHAPLQETGMTATLKILEDLVALGSQVDNSPDKKDEQAKKREFFIDSIHSFSKVLSFHFSLKEAYSLTLSFLLAFSSWRISSRKANTGRDFWIAKDSTCSSNFTASH
jgi:hypothetical protein